MSPELRERLESVRVQRDELGGALSEPGLHKDPVRYRDLSRQYARLNRTVESYDEYLRLEADAAAAEELIGQSPAGDESVEWAREELESGRERLVRLGEEIELLLLPQDPDNAADVYLEIRAGTGGEEAGLFAGDLLRMYARHAERRGWDLSLLSAREGETGGYREVVARVTGEEVYMQLRYESGVHRVQRVPRTESQGRIHTSTCTVAVLPVREDAGEVEIAKEDIRVDTFRASGAGGQHVNKTDSAIRITHLPSGISVECQDQRSQHQNRAQAMALLAAKLRDLEQQAIEQDQAEARRSMIGTGERAEKIRTYNFPQGRMTDHRIGLTQHNLPALLDGDLDGLLQTLQREDQLARLLASG
ncbi:MAG: peptide chain release factor 1 [Gammaproteobacteria bacterium AqS3]|nr:peptide chain release factor 1 [Gammaproteobacteria bacterium AqS3]